MPKNDGSISQNKEYGQQRVHSFGNFGGPRLELPRAPESRSCFLEASCRVATHRSRLHVGIPRWQNTAPAFLLRLFVNQMHLGWKAPPRHALVSSPCCSLGSLGAHSQIRGGRFASRPDPSPGFPSPSSRGESKRSSRPTNPSYKAWKLDADAVRG